MRRVAEAAEHAKALVTALSRLSGKVPRQLLLSALKPLLDPLARILVDAGEDEEGA
jgi:hypothetical protein